MAGVPIKADQGVVEASSTRHYVELYITQTAVKDCTFEQSPDDIVAVRAFLKLAKNLVEPPDGAIRKILSYRAPLIDRR